MTSPSEAFSALYQKYAPEVYRFAIYLTGDRVAAEDIVADTFAAVWLSSRPIAGTTVRAYLFTIARNLYHRGGRRGRHHAQLDADVADSTPPADARLEAADMIHAARRRLDALPERLRTAVAMRAAGLDYDDIGRALGITAGNARVLVHRARLALADLQ